MINEILNSWDELIECVKDKLSSDELLTTHRAVYYRKCIGDPATEISITACKILLDNDLGFKPFIASILIDADLNKEEHRIYIKQEFDDEILSLIRLSKKLIILDPIINKAGYSIIKDQLRKAILAIAKDPRVIAMWLAACISRLRHMSKICNEEDIKDSKKILDIHSSLANRLGLFSLKWEIEDLSFKIINIDQYKYIAKKINISRCDREAYVLKAQDSILNNIQDLGISTKITGRSKHIYSIYKKIQNKGIKFNDIHDLHAIRIVVKSESDCYKALSIIHNIYSPSARGFRDYILNPKKNGYQSIHTVILFDNKELEVQIRTESMDNAAESGPASHWKYKENNTTKNNKHDSRVDLLRELLSWKDDVLSRDEWNKAHDSVPEDTTIYALTPKYDVIDIPEGSTPIDFAYKIHTNIGHRCKGAKVNYKIVPLHYKLCTGDIVDIITGKQEKPSRDWLSKNNQFTVTIKAKQKIRNYFSAADNIKPSVNKKETQCSKLKQKNIRRLKILSSDIINIMGFDYIKSNIAKCCNPVPEDHIIAYISKNSGIQIHRSSCKNLKFADDNRKIEASWNRYASSYPFAMDISLISGHCDSIVVDLKNALTNNHMSLKEIHYKYTASEIRIIMSITYIPKKVGNPVNILKNIKKVVTVERLSG